MRHRILGALGVIWGGFILLNALTGGGPAVGGNEADNAGQYAGLAFGTLLFVAGLYALIKGDGGGLKQRRFLEESRLPSTGRAAELGCSAVTSRPRG